MIAHFCVHAYKHKLTCFTSTTTKYQYQVPVPIEGSSHVAVAWYDIQGNSLCRDKDVCPLAQSET